jgi:hypothetical protein
MSDEKPLTPYPLSPVTTGGERGEIFLPPSAGQGRLFVRQHGLAVGRRRLFVRRLGLALGQGRFFVGQHRFERRTLWV